MKVILASRNAGKLREMNEIMSKYGMDVVSRDDAALTLSKLKRQDLHSRRTHILRLRR